MPVVEIYYKNEWPGIRMIACQKPDKLPENRHSKHSITGY